MHCRSLPSARANLFVLALLLAGCGTSADNEFEPISQAKLMDAWLHADASTQGQYVRRLPPQHLVPSMLQELSDLTGLPVRKHVPVTLLPAEEQEVRLTASLSDKAEEIPSLAQFEAGLTAVAQALGLTSMFGLEPAGDDRVAEGGEPPPPSDGALLGFYDTQAKAFFLREGLPATQQLRTMRHELVHALQDQSYDLDSQIAAALPDFDRLMAIKAVVEGQAEAVAALVTMARQQEGSQATEATPLTLARLGPEAWRQVAALGPHRSGGRRLARRLLALPWQARVPRAEEQLAGPDVTFFPYLEGAKFVVDLFTSRPHQPLAKWIDTMFTRPPLSTAEIYRPERYLAALAQGRPRPLAPGTLSARSDYELLWRSALGEFTLRGYLLPMQRMGLAAHLEQDLALVLSPGPGLAPIVAWLTAWNSQAAASDFAKVAASRQQRAAAGEAGRCQLLQEGRLIGLLCGGAHDDTLVEGLRETLIANR